MLMTTSQHKASFLLQPIITRHEMNLYYFVKVIAKSTENKLLMIIITIIIIMIIIIIITIIIAIIYFCLISLFCLINFL